jgi:mannitol operon transcriptional antiterminator
MNERQIKVLYHMLSYPVDSYGQMAQQLDIHERTLYRDVKKILEWLVHNKLLEEVELGAGQATIWQHRHSLLGKVDQLLEKTHRTKYDAQSRRMAILTELLFEEEPLKIYTLAEGLHVTESTILSDLDRLETWMKDHQVRLIRKQGLGVYLEGDENQIRNAIMAVIFQEAGFNRMRGFLTDRKYISDYRRSGDPVERLLERLNEPTITSVLESIRNMEEQRGDRFSDDAYMGLFIHMMIALTRIQRGEVITMSRDILEALQTTPEYAIAQNAVEQLEKQLNAPIPAEETAYITMHLRGAKLAGKRLAFEQEIHDQYQVEAVARTILDRATELTGMGFDRDEDLYQGLLIHLRPAMTRLEHGLEIRNPLLSQIKEQYGELFYLAREVCKVITEVMDTPVPEAEVAFVAMHLGAFVERNRTKSVEQVHVLVVCPSGMGTSRLLTSKIRKHFQEVHVIGTTSIEEAEEFLSMNPRVDLVISTVDLGERSFPYLVVSPLLPDIDVEKIRVRIRSNLIPPYRVEPVDVEKNKPAFDFDRAKGYMDAWDRLEGSLFIKEGLQIGNRSTWISYIARYIHLGDPEKEHRLRRELEEREALMGTGLGQYSLALVHCRTKTMEKNVAGIFRNKQKVTFSDMEGHPVQVDTVLMLLAGTEATKEDMEGLSRISAAIVEDPMYPKMLREGSMVDWRDRLKSLYGQLVVDYVHKTKAGL